MPAQGLIMTYRVQLDVLPSCTLNRSVQMKRGLRDLVKRMTVRLIATAAFPGEGALRDGSQNTVTREPTVTEDHSIYLDHYRFQCLNAAFEFGLFRILHDDPGITRTEIARGL